MFYPDSPEPLRSKVRSVVYRNSQALGIPGLTGPESMGSPG